jgi:hypothetical protein
MNREDELNKTFPLEDGTTYIQSIDKANEPTGVGGESIKENFIDSKIKQMNKPKVTIDELHTFLTNVIELKVGIRRKIVALKDFINKIESDSSPIKENFIDSSVSQSGSWDDNKIHTEQDFMYNWIRKHSGK